MSSVENREVSDVALSPGAWGEEEERRLQEDIDVVIDFMAVASIMWNYGNPDVALEVATCARVALDRIIEMCSSSRATEASASGAPWDFTKLLGSLGGEALGEVIYWAAKARCLQVPQEAVELLRDFAGFVGIEDEDPELLGERILDYVSRSLNMTLASLVISARRVQ